MQTCANARAWKNALQISSNIMVLNGKIGLEYILIPNANNANSNEMKRVLVMSPVLKLRLEGLFRLKLFDEVIEEINSALTNASNLTSLPSSTSAISPTSSDQSSHEPIRCNITQEMKYAAVIPHLDFDTLMILNMMTIEVRLVTGRTEEAMEELGLLKQQLYIDPMKVKEIKQSEWSRILKGYYWYWVVVMSLCNACCRQRQWRICITELTNMLKDIVQLRVLLVGIHKESGDASVPEEGGEEQSQSQSRNGFTVLMKQLYINISNTEIIVRCRLCRLLLHVSESDRCIYVCNFVVLYHR